MSTRRAYLALADGTVFPGKAFGSDTPTVVKSCSPRHDRLQEVLTDPSYTGQIVTMTVPQVGNTGINHDDAESVNDKPQVAGFVIREESPIVSNYRSQETLDAYLARHGIIGISEIDTRKLTRHLRDNGSQNGAIGTEAPDTLVDRARAAPDMEGLDLVMRVSPKSSYEFSESRKEWNVGALDPRGGGSAPSGRNFHVVAFDYGAKRNILRCLVDSGFKVTVVPADTSAETVLGLAPDGVFLSNGPVIRRLCRTRSRASAAYWARNRSSASASGISCSRAPWAAAPTS